MSIKEDIAVTVCEGKEGIVRARDTILRYIKDYPDEKTRKDNIQRPAEVMQLLNDIDSSLEKVLEYLNIPQYRQEPGRKVDKYTDSGYRSRDSQTLLTFKDAQTQYNVADCQDDRVSDSLIAQASANGTAKLATANGCRRLVKSLNLDRPSTTD